MALPLLDLHSLPAALDILSTACIWVPSCRCTPGYSDLHPGQWLWQSPGLTHLLSSWCTVSGYWTWGGTHSLWRVFQILTLTSSFGQLIIGAGLTELAGHLQTYTHWQSYYLWVRTSYNICSINPHLSVPALLLAIVLLIWQKTVLCQAKLCD